MSITHKKLINSETMQDAIFFHDVGRAAGQKEGYFLPAYSACSASSVFGGESIGVGHGTGRLDSNQGWSAKNNRAGEWWQMDVGSVKLIEGVVTQGRTSHNQYVKSYKVQLSTDGKSWSYVDGGKVFAANTGSNNNYKDNKFQAAINARYDGKCQ